MKMDVNYFIKKFEAIPEESWYKGATSNYDGTRHCAHGHCGVSTKQMFTQESEVLSLLMLALPERKQCSQHTGYPPQKLYLAANINDGLVAEYPQDTPKKRVLAALYDVRNILIQRAAKVIKNKTIVQAKEKVEAYVC